MQGGGRAVSAALNSRH